jgi:hypothetical protein
LQGKQNFFGAKRREDYRLVRKRVTQLLPSAFAQATADKAGATITAHQVAAPSKLYAKASRRSRIINCEMLCPPTINYQLSTKAKRSSATAVLAERAESDEVSVLVHISLCME